MNGKQILNTFLKIVAWIGGGVLIPFLTAMGLSKAFGWSFSLIVWSFVVFYVGCFLLAFFYHHIRDFIKKIVINVLIEKKIIKEEKKNE